MGAATVFLPFCGRLIAPPPPLPLCYSRSTIEPVGRIQQPPRPTFPSCPFRSAALLQGNRSPYQPRRVSYTSIHRRRRRSIAASPAAPLLLENARSSSSRRSCPFHSAAAAAGNVPVSRDEVIHPPRPFADIFANAASSRGPAAAARDGRAHSAFDGTHRTAAQSAPASASTFLASSALLFLCSIAVPAANGAALRQMEEGLLRMSLCFRCFPLLSVGLKSAYFSVGRH